MEKYVIECEGEPPVYRVVLVVRTVQSAHQTLDDARQELRALENRDRCLKIDPRWIAPHKSPLTDMLREMAARQKGK
jgi:hypothetical protein